MRNRIASLTTPGLEEARRAVWSSRRKDRWRPRVERLEERVVLAPSGNVAMLAATSLSPVSVVTRYQITGSLTGAMTLGIYRSSTPSLDTSSVLVGQTQIDTTGLPPAVYQTTVSLTQPLDINPSLKYVLAVADSTSQIAETDETDNVASYRTWNVAAVTHGFEFDGQETAWVAAMTNGLLGAGFDAAVPFNWAALSAVPAPGSTTLAAQSMVVQVGQAISALPIHVNDVVNLQLIGHSRGGDVVSQVVPLINRTQAPLAGGYLKLTLLDPHPARNSTVLYFSSSNGPIGALAQADFVAFQAAANDPPLTIPTGVNSTEIFYQQTPVTSAVRPDELFINPWGEVPAGGSSAGLVYYNLTGIVPSHEGVHDFYLQTIVPLLATGAQIPLPPAPTPAPPTTGGPVFPNARLGTRYEYQVLVSGSVARPVARHLLNSFASLNLHLARRRFPAASTQLNRLGIYIARQAGRGIPAAGVPYLEGLLAQTRLLLFPRAGGAARSLAHHTAVHHATPLRANLVSKHGG